VFGLTVHYRWLEEPPDPAWLKGQALSRLDRPARRDPVRVAGEVQSTLKQRAELWNALAGLTGIAPETLALRRREVQRRVERVYDLVEQRQSQRAAEVECQIEKDGTASNLWGSA